MAFYQVSKCYIINDIIDSFFQLQPDFEGYTFTGTGTSNMVFFQTGDGSQTAFQ